MKGIQILLLGLVLMIFMYIVSRLRNRKADLIVLASIAIIGALFILFPDWTIVIAHKLGVGRGADMVFYISILLFWFVILKLYSRIRHLEKMITELVRKDALNSVASSEKTKSNNAQ
ncbi:MAG: DUF2304 domain-containing protein [Flavisolibacter sp.]